MRRADLAALGDDAPDGPVLGASVADVGVKAALIADDPDVFFTTPHFDGYAAVLVRLDKITVDELEELTVEAWLAKAPKASPRNTVPADPHESARPDWGISAPYRAVPDRGRSNSTASVRSRPIPHTRSLLHQICRNSPLIIPRSVS
nr:hypothetical protein [Actinokineospora xionganensis]